MSSAARKGRGASRDIAGRCGDGADIAGDIAGSERSTRPPVPRGLPPPRGAPMLHRILTARRGGQPPSAGGRRAAADALPPANMTDIPSRGDQGAMLSPTRRTWSTREAGGGGCLDGSGQEGHCEGASASALGPSRSSTRRTGSEREPDAPSSAGQPLSCRHSPGERPGNRDGGAARRVAAHRGGRSGGQPLTTGPEGRRGTARARWSTTRPDDQRPHGRRSRRAVTPLDAAREDGSFPPIPEASGPSANPTNQVPAQAPGDEAAGARGTEPGAPEGRR